MIDAILINPCLFKKNSNIWQKVDSCFPSLGLASIAAYARKEGFTVKIIDAPALKLTLENFESYLSDNFNGEDCRYIGLTATTSAVKNAYAMAEIAKKVFPSAKIVFGGVHATVLPDEVIRQKFVDLVVRGEGEVTFYEILKNVNLRNINGLVFKENGSLIYNPDRCRIFDLDGLPFPAYDLLPMDKYYPAQGSYKRLPAMSMFSTRGCPGQCTFCNKTLGNRIVFRSAESLVKEIQMLQSHYNIRQIMFYDDTFTVNKENVRKFCRILIEKKINISWCCFSRVDFIDLEILKLMKQAGCHQIMYGVESADQGILKEINKRIDLNKVAAAVALTKKAKIDLRLAFMIGNPSETRETVLKTLNYAIKLNPDLVSFNITTPYPGTQMFDEASKNNLILTYDWDDYDLSRPIMKLKNLSQEEIKNLYRYCYRKFYLRPRYILNRLIRLITRPNEIFSLIYSGKSLFSFLKVKD
jgi:anaerobic magnesium-protoporphyrin IX monomethyl ester cyclase